MKKICLLLFISLTFGHFANAQLSDDEQIITLDEFIKEAQQDNPTDIMDFDINDDHKISLNELTEIITGFRSNAVDLEESQKQELGDKLSAKFKECDKNNDGYLDAEESKELNHLLTTMLTTYQFQKIDRNHDGVFSTDDIPTIEESMKKLTEATQKLQEATEKLEQTPPEQFAANLFSGLSVSLAKENYFGMDKDKNNCVTMEEYVSYNLQKQAEDTDKESAKYNLNRKELIRMYVMEKKQKPNCLTQEEYLENEQKMMDEIMKTPNFTDSASEEEYIEKVLQEKAEASENDKEFAEFIFDEMDIDNDGKITKDEFTNFETANNEGSLTAQTFAEVFNSMENSQKGWLTKEEFLKEYSF